MSRWRTTLLLGAVSSLWLATADSASALSARDYPELGGFIEEMAQKHGLPEDELARWFEKTRIRQDALAAIRAPKEALPWHRYRELFVTRPSAQRGARFWREHAQTLVRAEREFGVDAATIVAILGIETQYGRNGGRYPVMDTLVTLMLEYPRRRSFFRRELEEYLLLTREHKFDPLELRGSYAGAIGVPQFIPSSYRRYAVDFDGDRRIDLIGSYADAIGSVASYFRQHGWQQGTPVIADIELNSELIAWLAKLGDRPVVPMRYLLGYGVLPLDYGNIDQSAALIRLEEPAGAVYRLGYNNFYVITRYNRSRNYAMAVYELARSIRRIYETP